MPCYLKRSSPRPQLHVILIFPLRQRRRSMPVFDSTRASLNLNPPTKPCHNCRRRRWRCDRSLPGCEKCHKKGDICLGYGKLFRWAGVGAVTVRGSIHGPGPQHRSTTNGIGKWDSASTTSAEVAVRSMGDSPVLSPVQFSLVDPLLQDLAPRNRHYISHCESEAFRYSGLVWSKISIPSLTASPPRRKVGLS